MEPLVGRVLDPGGDAHDRDRAARLLELLGAKVPPSTGGSWDAERAWAASGAMALTGDPGGPPRIPAGPVGAALGGAVAAWRVLAGSLGIVDPPPLDGPALAGERAAILGLHRGGEVSCGGSCRLVAVADGLLAVNLPRPDDLELVPAWVAPVVHDLDAPAWDLIAAAAPFWTTATAVETGAELGLLVARCADSPATACADEQGRARGQAVDPLPWLLSDPTAAPRRPGQPLVVDLTSLWAGPLAVQLLRAAGCRTVKVEHIGRPDGARRGPRAFFDVLHHGTESVAIDPERRADRELLHRLVGRADVVVEALRPAGAARLGLDPRAWRARRPELVWVTISGYGRTGPWAGRPALGDDAAAAGGAVAVASGAGFGPAHLADAWADPVTGVHAAVVGLAGLVGGVAFHADVAMREVVAHCLSAVAPDRARPGRPRNPAGWEVGSPDPTPVAGPRARSAAGRAPGLGSHTVAWAAALSPFG